MKKIQKYSALNRFLHSKENRGPSSESRNSFSIEKEEPLEEWKEGTQRVIFKEATNKPLIRKIAAIAKKRALTEPDSPTGIPYLTPKVSEIEVLKRQAELLQSQYFESKKTVSEILKTEPLNLMKNVPIRLDNWLKTTNSGFFKAEERHSMLEKKRSKIKKLKKGYVPIPPVLESTATPKPLQPCETIEMNKPLLLYPLMDSMYHKQIKERLRTPSIKSITDFSADRIKQTKTAKESFRVKTAKVEMRTISNIKITGLRARAQSQYFNF